MKAETTDRLILGVAAFASLLILLLPALRTGFLSDDYLDLHHNFSAASFTRFEFTGFRPLNEAIYSLDARVWGEQKAWGWHLTNLVIHALCAFLFWRCALSLCRNGRSAAFATALFLVSFAVVPSVARMSGRTTPAAVVPFLAAMLSHSYWESRKRLGFLILGQTLFMVSLFTKETLLACAPVFGLISAHLAIDNGGRTSRFMRVTALYLIPMALYLAWRFYWLGFVFGYADSTRFGPFIIGNLISLIRMPFTPWFDGIPLRMLAVLATAVFFLARAPWHTKLMVAALILLPIATVCNLPPRSYYAYAALPGSALLFGMVAGSLKGRTWSVLVSVALLGCFLSARDELSRFRQADSYTERTIRALDSLGASNPGGALFFVSGIDYDVAGYGTLWPGAYPEALSTIGADGSRLFEDAAFWETCWPILEEGAHPVGVFTRLSEAGYDTLRFNPSSRFQPLLPPDTVIHTLNRRIDITGVLWRMSSCSVTGYGHILLPDPFTPERWVEIPPFEARGDTAVYDLESSVEWLLSDTSRGCCMLLPDGDAEAVFSSDRLWLEPLEQRLSAKSESLQQNGARQP